jgi:hypothetical protein
MKIEIEIGDSDLKNQITEEINLVIGDYYSNETAIPRFIIPLDFQEKVRVISGDNTYQASRQSSNQSALAITFKDKGVIILNPELYKNPIDIQIRANVYHHEYFHFLYKTNTMEYNFNTKKGQYESFVNLYIEEFKAIRHGLKFAKKCFANSSEPFKSFLKLALEGHYKNLTNRGLYHTAIKNEIIKYKYRNCTLEDLLGKVFPKIKSYSLELISFDAYNEIANDMLWFSTL